MSTSPGRRAAARARTFEELSYDRGHTWHEAHGSQLILPLIAYEGDMIFNETKLPGAYLVELERKEDARGFNARTWCRGEFERAGLVDRMVQQNVIYNRARGTLRGMHYQKPPLAETKLFRVTRGAIYDVIVDLRPESPTYLQWASFELRASAYTMLYVPERFGQGFLTLDDETELTYQVSAPYTPGHEGGFRHDDPAFAIEWPEEVRVISEKDRSWAPFDEAIAGLGESVGAGG